MEKSGRYVQGETRLSGEDIQESIRQISAAIMSIEDVSEALAVNSSGHVEIIVSATVTVDEEVMNRRIQDLLASEHKQHQIRQLKVQNSALQEQLRKLNHELLISSRRSTSELLSRQELLIKELQENEKKTELVFSEGVLFKTAQLRKTELSIQTLNIHENIIDHILRTEINLEVTDIIPDQDKFIVYVRVSWMLDHENISNELKKYFSLPRQDQYESAYLSAVEYNQQTPEALYLLQYIRDNPIDAMVRVGGITIRLPVLYTGADFGARPASKCQNPLNSKQSSYAGKGMALCAVSLTQKKSYHLPKRQRVPLKFRLSSRELKDLSNIRAEMSPAL